MRYEETDSLGSFAALGIGFLYEYDARLKTFHISRAGSCVPLVFHEFDSALSKDPFEFVRIFEKTTQIEALKFSNNMTINLAGTLDDTRLPAILHRALRMALYGFNMKKEKFSDFRLNFLADNELKRLEIKKAESYAKTPFYIANAETKRGNYVSVRSTTLHGATSYLSDKIMHDIIAKEFGYNVDAWVHKLLNTAALLSTLSFVINDKFEPARKMASKGSSLLARLSVMQKNSINSNT